MKMEIDSTIASVLIVIAVLGTGLFLEDIKTIALGAIALLILLIATKIIYFELPVILAMVALGIIALYGDELSGLFSEAGIKLKDEIDTRNPSSEEEKKFIEEVKKAYAEQYAGTGQVITVDPDYAKRLFEAAGAGGEFKEKFGVDDQPLIFIGGVDKIEKIIISSDKPLPADGQVDEMIKDRRIWVKVKIGDRDDIWVRVKAFVGKRNISVAKSIADVIIGLISENVAERYDGAVWDIDLSYFDRKPLYSEFGMDITSEPDRLVDGDTMKPIASKVKENSHYWPYDIAEV